MPPIGVGIIGCGLIGHKRSQALCGAELRACADIDLKKAETLAGTVKGARAMSDWRVLVADPEIKIVIVATPNNLLAEVTNAALEAGKDVLVEKPAARTLAEVEALLATARKTGGLVRVGFNHRYHPSLQRARQIVDEGPLGPLMFVRGRYGHGGRVGYEKEWRANPALSGGGELIDQGVHLIDLSRWFLGEFTDISGHAQTCFWDMPVDDNAFMVLRTEKKQTAFLHVSCSEWKNLFSLEIYGRDGKLQIDGLGGSYGIEKLTYYKMLPEMGPPDTTSWEYPHKDRSWEIEFREFLEDVTMRRQPSAGLEDARAAMEVVSTIYRRSGYDNHA